MIRIIIVDDHQILRDGLRQMLSREEEFQIIGEASNGQEALDMLRTLKPDILLMDVSMPVMDGVEATARINALYPDIKILALTMLDQGSFVQLLLRNGASGFLVKDSGKEELIYAIREVFHHDRYIGVQATELLFKNVVRQQKTIKTFLPKLTRREKEVLKWIMQGMSDMDIAGQLLVSPSTIESHRKNIRSKLGARNSAEIVRIAMERGLLE